MNFSEYLSKALEHNAKAGDFDQRDKVENGGAQSINCPAKYRFIEY